MEKREVLCVYCPRALRSSSVRRYETFMEWLKCLFSNVVDRLFVATNQSTKDRRIQTLRLDTNQLSLMQDPTCVVTCITSRGEMKWTLCLLRSSNVSPKFASMKQALFKRKIYPIHDAFQQQQNQWMTLHYKTLHRNRHGLTSTLYRCFLMSQ